MHRRHDRIFNDDLHIENLRSYSVQCKPTSQSPPLTNATTLLESCVSSFNDIVADLAILSCYLETHSCPTSSHEALETSWVVVMSIRLRIPKLRVGKSVNVPARKYANRIPGYFKRVADPSVNIFDQAVTKNRLDGRQHTKVCSNCSKN